MANVIDPNSSTLWYFSFSNLEMKRGLLVKEKVQPCLGVHFVQVLCPFCLPLLISSGFRL